MCVCICAWICGIFSLFLMCLFLLVHMDDDFMAEGMDIR